jgi:ELWxxDGT repeat protein
VLNLGVNAQAPGPFEYNPENNTLTNNSEVHLAPQFINGTTGNGSTWQVADILSASAGSSPGIYGMEILVGDTLYFSADDVTSGVELWAHDTSNASTWQVADINSGTGDSYPGASMVIVVGDTLYFNANGGSSSGYELWAHDTSNASTWQVADIWSGGSSSSPGQYMSILVGDTLYFSALDAQGTNHELWAHDTSNASTWQVADINSGSGGSSPGKYMEILVGDTLYFSANDGSSGHELWAHDTSNASTWRVADIYSGTGGSYPGSYMEILVGDTLYFSANDPSSGHELWAHDTSNASTWQVADIYSGSAGSHPGQYMQILVGDTLYFDAIDGSSGNELWAHDTSNASTWRVADINSGTGYSNPGQLMAMILVGDTIYFDAFDASSGRELWAHDTSNASTWRVADIYSGTGNSSPGIYMAILVGDTLYFGAYDGSSGRELWAHDTSNASTWRVADINSGTGYSNPGYYMEILVGDTLYFDANDGSSGIELWAHRPSTIDYNTNTGGAVTSWAINASLPSGVSFGTNNGTIYGTPTELWTQTSYMVWANNSGGQSVAYLNITVVDELPTLSYSPENLTLTKGQSSTDLPLNATLTGSGTITSWTISPALPSGLSFGTSNGTIWGIPTVLQTTATTYTILANNTGGSTSATVTITINDAAPGPFEYNPENNTLTNNTYVHLEPDFINITTGNGSTWSTTPTGYQLTTSFHGDVPCLNQTYNGTIYASYNAKLHGYGIANNTLWLINNTIESVGCDTYFSWPSSTGYTQSVSHSYGTSLYFTGIDGSDRNLYGYGMENGTIWVESTADPGMWSMMVDDVMYFFGETGNSGYELHGHNLSNGTTWMLDDLFSGSGSITGPTLTNNWPVLVGSTFVFGAVFTNSSTSRETWAHNISNGTSWRLSTNDASTHNAPVLGDVVYFTNNNGFWNELHAYNASNETFWKVVAGPFGGPFEVDGILYGYVPSPYSSQPSKLRAHNPANGTTWDAAVPGSLHLLNMGGTLYYAGSLTGTNNLQLWAYEPTNSTGWKVSDLTIPFSVSMNWVFIALGDVIYFTASNGTTSGLWAHSSSNHSTWFVSNLFSSNNAAAVAVVNGTLYLGNSGMAGHQPASINYQTNTGGAVTSWAINASLPSGLTFSTTNGSIYGTPTELWTQTSYMVWANNSGGLKRGLSQHHRGGRAADAFLFSREFDADEGTIEHRFAVECNADWSGYDHFMGHQSSTAKRSILWYEQRNDLGNTNFLNVTQDVHDLGQQQRRLVFSHSQHHRER